MLISPSVRCTQLLLLSFWVLGGWVPGARGQMPGASCLPPPAVCPLNEFVVGMFSFDSINNISFPTSAFYTDSFNHQHPSSQLNGLSADGFDTVQYYGPGYWNSLADVTNLLTLFKVNGMRILPDERFFYVPNSSTACGLPSGTNVYNGNPPYDNYWTMAYALPAFAGVVFGHKLTEEASYYHGAYMGNQPPFYPNPAYGWCDTCVGCMQTVPPYCSSILTCIHTCECGAWKFTEIPPSNVSDAMGHYRALRQSLAPQVSAVGRQRLAVMEANHGKSIQENTRDGDGFFNPQDYLPLANRADLFLEGSYLQLPSSWATQLYLNVFSPTDYHYLGFLKSIDFAQMQVPEVHKVVNIEGGQQPTSFHGDLSSPNANLLWFQAYASIVHGATGVWFWDLASAWSHGQPGSWAADPARFEPSNFPDLYKAYVAPLARELRYLIGRNVLAQANSSTAPSVLNSKTDHPDDFCIVGKPSSYIPLGDHQSEGYGVRYTILSGGQDVIMIAVNPLPLWIDPTLDFSAISNGVIANASGVEALFETPQDAIDLAQKSASYKTNRAGRVTLTSPWAATRQISYSGHRFTDRFGPLDVHVYRFRPGTGSTPSARWYHAALNWDGLGRAAGDIAVSRNGVTMVFYRGADARVYLHWWDGRRWRSDALDYNAPARTAGDLVVDPSGTSVYFRGTDNRLYNFWWNPGKAGGAGWQEDALDYNAPARTAGNLVLDPSGTNVYFRGTDNRLYNFWWNPGKAGGAGWQQDALDYNAAPRTAGDLVVDPLGTSVYFRGTDNRLYNFWWNPSKAGGAGWQEDALDYNAAPRTAGNLVLDPSGTSVYFRGTDNRLYNFWWNPGKTGGAGWQEDALDYNAPPRTAGNLVVDPLGSRVFFRGTDNRLYNFWWNPGKAGGAGWQQDALDYNAPALVGGDIVLGPPAPGRDVDHVYYRGTDGRMYNFWWTGSRWENDVLNPCAPPIVGRGTAVDAGGILYYIGKSSDPNMDGRIFEFYWTDK